MEMRAIGSTGATGVDLAVLSGRASADVKLAHKVVVMLQHEIISKGLKHGHSLGTAAEIRVRYQVGRWAFREALGILELRGIARLRSGPGGGVIVTEPDFGDLVSLTLLYLYANRSGPSQINEVRRSVITAVTMMLLDRGPALALPACYDRHDPTGGVARFLADRTGNEALKLAVEFAECVTEACVPALSSSSRWQHDGRALWLAICQGDRDVALAKLDALLTADEHHMASIWAGLPELSTRRSGAGKLAYRLALDILRDVVEHPERSGDFVGSETEIGVRFNANAEIVRQAVRLIEDLGVVAPRRGRHGGVVVRSADVASIAALIPHLLSLKQVSVATCCDAAFYISDQTARLAAKRVKDAEVAPQAGAEAPGEVSYGNAMKMNRQIQVYAQNPLLSSIERGMGFYSYAIDPPVFDRPPPTDRVLALSRKVLEAVEAGDIEGASAATRERFSFMSMRFATQKDAG